MSRPLRILFPGAWYHVMNRGRHGETTFRDKTDFFRFRDLLKESTGRFNVGISAYCFMTNHYHLLMQTMLPNLPRAMRHIDGVYSQYFNKKYGLDGSLFKGRYKAVLIDAEGYLCEVLRYIHRNPRKAGLESIPGKYPWTSHRGYVSNTKSWAWLHKGPVLSTLSKNQGEWKRSYLELMSEEVPAQISGFFSSRKLGATLGSKSFVAWVRETFSDILTKEDVQGGSSVQIPLEDLVSAIKAHFGIDEAELTRRAKSKPNQIRDLAIYMAVIHTSESLSSISRRFDLKRHCSASSLHSKVREALKKDAHLRQIIKVLEQSLTKHQITT